MFGLTSGRPQISNFSQEPQFWVHAVQQELEVGHESCMLIHCLSHGRLCCRYGMLDPSLKDKEGLPLTIRAVFIVGEPQVR